MYDTTEHDSSTKNLRTHHCIGFATPPKMDRITKMQSKRPLNSLEKQEENYKYSNQLFPSSSSSRIVSDELRDQNFYRKTVEYRSGSGSHSSSTATTSSAASAAKKSDSFFDMLQDYQPAVLGVICTDQRSPGPAEFMQDRDTQNITSTSTIHPVIKDTQRNVAQPQTDSSTSTSIATKTTRDLRVKNKLHRFLVQPKSKAAEEGVTSATGLLGLSLLAKNTTINEDVAKPSFNSSSTTNKIYMSTEDMEEQQRQRVFAHYDCQSLAANLNYLKNSRKLTAVGSTNGSAKESNETSAVDYSEGNELLEGCSIFCSEIGGEYDRRFSSKKSNANDQNGFVCRAPRRPITPCSVSILESLPNETLWRVGMCPFQNDSCPIEAVDHGAHYYKRYFYNQKHENWFGIDENLGPTAISIKKEKLHDDETDSKQSQARYQFRMIIRTSELLTLRGVVVEELIINSRVSGKSVSSKELLECVAPDIQLNCLRLGVHTPNCEQQLLQLDEQGLTSKYKVGILYCRSGQSTEEDMYNNEHAGPAFTEFLDVIGKRVRLKGFQQYKAGLDNKSDSTGTHSVHAFYKNCEVMFHVCTMLPFTPNNRQQLLRKRHIGNDIVTIIFQEPGALPFDPKNIRSQFQHVFLIVRAVNPCSNNTTYRVAISRSKEVPSFGPPLPASALFTRNKMFAEFILSKTINAENAAHRSEKFANLAIRTRREYLKDLCINYCTNTYMDPVNKFSIFANKKKEKAKIRFSGDVAQRGAICWRIMLHDHVLDMETECLLGISIETFAVVAESTKQVIFAMPTRSILGWSTFDSSIRIFYHNGECITIKMRYFGGMDEQVQVIERLRAVSLGNAVQELNMRRNMMGQLGFHVQPDGIVTQVDATGQAWAAGMRRGYRLVEVCKVVVATLSYAELIDLLKTSAQMNAVVIKSISDGTPRFGCFNKHCKLNLLSSENDQSSSKCFLEKDGYSVKSLLRNESLQHPVLNYKSGPFEQRSLPHKSKSSSGYNTGSSCFSSNSLGEEYKKVLHTTNSCSPHSSKNDRWYNTFDEPDQRQKITFPPSHQYSLHPIDRTVKSEAASPVLTNNSTPSPLLMMNEGSKVQTWLQSDKSNFPAQADCRKLLKNRSSEYEVTGLKRVNISPSQNYTSSASTSHSKSNMESNRAIEVFKIKKESRIVPSSLAVKDPKHSSSSVSNLNATIRVQQSMGNYSSSNQFRPDLLEIISPHFSSEYDSLKAKIIPVVERDNNLHMLDNTMSSLVANNLKLTDKKPTSSYRGSSAAISPSELCTNQIERRAARQHQHLSCTSGSSANLKQTHGRESTRNTIQNTPPLLPYSKELDWSTLVDTATKAIILQHRDDNRNRLTDLWNLSALLNRKNSERKF